MTRQFSSELRDTLAMSFPISVRWIIGIQGVKRRVKRCQCRQKHPNKQEGNTNVSDQSHWLLQDAECNTVDNSRLTRRTWQGNWLTPTLLVKLDSIWNTRPRLTWAQLCSRTTYLSSTWPSQKTRSPSPTRIQKTWEVRAVLPCVTLISATEGISTKDSYEIEPLNRSVCWWAWIGHSLSRRSADRTQRARKREKGIVQDNWVSSQTRKLFWDTQETSKHHWTNTRNWLSPHFPGSQRTARGACRRSNAPRTVHQAAVFTHRDDDVLSTAGSSKEVEARPWTVRSSEKMVLSMSSTFSQKLRHAVPLSDMA